MIHRNRAVSGAFSTDIGAFASLINVDTLWPHHHMPSLTCEWDSHNFCRDSCLRQSFSIPYTKVTWRMWLAPEGKLSISGNPWVVYYKQPSTRCSLKTLHCPSGLPFRYSQEEYGGKGGREWIANPLLSPVTSHFTVWGWALVAQAFNTSSGGRGRCASVSSRPAQPTEQVPGLLHEDEDTVLAKKKDWL